MSATVQIRIAIALATDGTWAAAGKDDDLTDFLGDEMEAARTWLVEAGCFPVRCFWLVAEVPIPNATPPEEIPAEIEEQP